MSELARVHEWNEVAGNKRNDTELFYLYHDLIKEEYTELQEAKSRREILDACGDLLVVVTGLLHSMGENADKILSLINDSNFSKFDVSEEDANTSVAQYTTDHRYCNVRWRKVGDLYVIIGDKVGGGKTKVLKSHKYHEPKLED